MWYGQFFVAIRQRVPQVDWGGGHAHRQMREDKPHHWHTT